MGRDHQCHTEVDVSQGEAVVALPSRAALRCHFHVTRRTLLMIRFLFNFTLLLLVLLIIEGCSQREETPSLETESAEVGVDNQQSSGNTHADSPISWFSGSVEEAFSLAQEKEQPLFFYWGAVWCPPCQEIKTTVFKSNDFIALSKLFIPVYLDGDSLQAQSWGEHFGVKGYPTMIVFDPAGEEVTRIPGGIDIALYAGILELALNHLRPTADLIRLALDQPEKLQSDDITQLAFYSWGQDHQAVPEEGQAALFKSLSKLAVEDPIANTRLFMQYLLALSDQQEQPTMDPQEAIVARQQVERILDNPLLTRTNWDYLTGYPETFVVLLTDEGASRQKLIDRWSDMTLALRDDASLTTSDQLGGWYPTLELHWLSHTDSERLPEQLARQLKADIAIADQKTSSPYARQSVMYTAASLLRTAHLYDEAEALLLAELQQSKSPYYFMSNLAGLAEKRGDYNAAVDWLKQAYITSDGRATRFQWGVQYVTGVIRMQPQQQQLVVNTTLGLFNVLEKESDVFSGRNFSRLKTLRKSLDSWQGKGTNGSAIRLLIQPFYDKLDSLCEQLDASIQESQNCRSLQQS